MTTPSASSASAASAGLLMATRNASEPLVTMLQKALVAWVPNSPLAGTA